MTWIHLNGRLVAPGEGRIDPADRGLLLADGLFETLRAYGGRPFRLEAHLTRLADGAAVIGLAMPPAAEIAAAVGATLTANGLEDAAIRITLTRGSGPRGLLPPPDAKPTLLVAAHPLPASLPAATTACIVAPRRNEQSPLSRLKSLAYLDNILALREAVARGCDEAILLNTAGRLASGSRSNLFLVLDDTLSTPPPVEGVLPGIARQTVLDLAAGQGMPTQEMPLTLADIARASEAFLTNSLLEVVPLARIEDRTLAPGPAGAELACLYRQLATRDDRGRIGGSMPPS
jgi:branched-chain amino acid aminotransferase